MRIDIVSLFPEYFRGPFDESMIGRARRQGILDIHLIDLRQYGVGNHKQVDDRAYGGGPGMVLMAGPVSQALGDAKGGCRSGSQRTVFLSPQGTPLNAKKCRELSAVDHLILLCGHYEGVDQRILDREIDEEISIGDYVLTNGCLPAIVLVDAMARFIPGVIGHGDAADEDSFEKDLLDCPHYTRPEVFEGMQVPQVLLEGNHGATAHWRREQSVVKTRECRPDLLTRYLARQCSEELESNKASTVRLKRLTLFVEDVRRSRRYYREMLAMRPVCEDDAEVVFAIGDVEIALALGAKASGPLMIAAMVDDQQQLNRIAQRVEIGDCGGVEVGEGVSKVWFIDPDGYQWVISGLQK
ncbi:MAG: tRNA (guanosine(37)-N1)-methyltransferase TrmD [Nitrosomonas sp.]|nr:MAG: tRNA (guanosine(37)-N1)-methyltransferase TrmD [Nitrosomonas sp.]